MSSVRGITAAKATSICAAYPDAASLCEALVSDASASDPPSRAQRLFHLGLTTSLRLVAEFLDGQAALYRLMDAISEAPASGSGRGAPGARRVQEQGPQLGQRL